MISAGLESLTDQHHLLVPEHQAVDTGAGDEEVILTVEPLDLVEVVQQLIIDVVTTHDHTTVITTKNNSPLLLVLIHNNHY